jgi:hypothetical protein
MVTEFPKSIHDKLKYYVYLYIDPRDDTIFYVGKGKCNRAFAHLHDKSEKEKVKRIRDIRKAGKEPRIEILVHGVDDETAKKIEASVIDLIGMRNLTNIQAGYESGEYGRMSLDQVVATYERDSVEINEPVLLININQSFRFGMPEVELYDATRSAWVVGDKRESARYAFAVYQGIVQEVYEITGWFPNNSTFNTRKQEETDPHDVRWEFVGKIANESIRKEYLHKDVSSYVGTQNPIRYVNCQKSSQSVAAATGSR